MSEEEFRTKVDEIKAEFHCRSASHTPIYVWVTKYRLPIELSTSKITYREGSDSVNLEGKTVKFEDITAVHSSFSSMA